MRFWFAAVGAMLAATGPACAQVAPAPQSFTLQRTAPRDGRAVAEDVRKVIRENYVVPEKRAPLDAVLARGIASGRYDGVEPGELAQRITDDLAGVAHDKHLNLRFDPRAGPPQRRGPGAGPPDAAAFEAQARSNNYGIVELKVLPGNVRVMVYNGFVWTGAESAKALDQAMAFLMGGDAAIIDLRGNGGGSPEAVRHIANYFVPPNTLLVTFHMRNDPPTTSSTGSAPPALGMWPKDKPVYVLTSGRTASAAEEFASHVAGFKFGTLVGETTAGAGYRNEIVPIEGGFALSVSVGRPELPDGRGDWEAKGVPPEVAVAVDKALPKALSLAYARLGATAPAGRKIDFEWLSAGQGALVSPAPLARPATAYAGRFGVRVISVEGERLVYRRDGGLSTKLLPIGPDLFALEVDPLQHVRFVVEGGNVTGFELMRSDGSSVMQPKGPPPAQ
ncbi:MAG: S41 family peptidase [Sphingomonas sp.]